MTVARFKDLCIDAVDPDLLAEFWAGALDLEIRRQDSGQIYLAGPTEQHTVWINKVPEAKTVKHRMHLDVRVADVSELEALGATVLDADTFRWVQMADPEGGEFCAFPTEDPITQRLVEIIADTADSAEASHNIASWWAGVLGADLVDDDHGYSYIDNIPGTPFGTIDFIPVPEPKTVKNRIHLDLMTSDFDALVAAGATVLRADEDIPDWTVMADPDGNEFCAFLE